MPRPRVLSFMSQWGGGVPKSPTTATDQSSRDTSTSPAALQQSHSPAPPPAATSAPSPTKFAAMQRPDSFASQRPFSMVQTYQPPVLDVAHDTLPELQPIFTFLNSHSNKLYHEGYFLKLNDLDARGRPCADRAWMECFAQLVGTVLSLWDAALLDQAGEEAEVIPTFINLADASIKMIPSLPMNGAEGQNLQNVLSISTAAKNRYLLHFNSLNSLTQWTAGIRLAMFEHATLQEAYTGSLIAGKGKSLNNIRAILERTRGKHEDWARVRFGVGTPWRRCWCVVSPPDEKEVQKLQKSLKKQSIYNRSKIVLKGDVKFYENKKDLKKKNPRPLATITEAYSAYAVFPQSKPLIDQSTLVKIEGRVTIHATQDTTTDGFVFVMPEVHPAVSGFEIMLRYLFPVYDTFALYGRPERLVAEVLDTRSLMFAMPKDRRYGHLDSLDVAGLVHTEGSENWTEREWRKELKELTAKRMVTPDRSRVGSRRNTINRASLPPLAGNALRFEENGSTQSQPGTRRQSPVRPQTGVAFAEPRRVDSAPPVSQAFTPPGGHRRSMSDATTGQPQYHSEVPSRLRNEYVEQPVPVHNASFVESPTKTMPPELQAATQTTPPPAPVAAPPSFKHAPSQRPPQQPYQSAELLRANSNVDPATLQQMADANNAPAASNVAAAGAAAAWRANQLANQRNLDHEQRSGSYNQGLGAYNNVWPNQSDSRLPTIPASPYVEQESIVFSTATRNQAPGPPVPPHSPNPQTYNPLEHIPHNHPNAHPPEYHNVVASGHARTDSNNSVHRKPVPGRSSTSSKEDFTTSSTPETQSLNSLRDHMIDFDALDNLTREDSDQAVAGRSRVLSDAESLASTDYASTISSTTRRAQVAPRRDVDAPRPGKLKTVGKAEPEKREVLVGDTYYDRNQDAAQTPVSSDIDVDFGPTFSLNPDTGSGRPGTSGTITGETRSKSRDRLGQTDGGRPGSNHGLLQDGRSKTPISPDGNAEHTPVTTPTDYRRSVAWQPGMSAGTTGHIARQSLTAEEWVQARASVVPNPQTYRKASPTPNRLSMAPPMNRLPSGDWSHAQEHRTSHARTPTADRLQRPHSRGASVMLTAQTPLVNSENTTLTAREQEFVARATGTPLLSLSDNKQKPHQRVASSGLIGAIEAREKEKANMKLHNGIGNSVSTAISKRYQQHSQKQAEAQLEAQAKAQAQASAAHMLSRPQSSMGIYTQTNFSGQSFQQPSRQPQSPYNQPAYSPLNNPTVHHRARSSNPNLLAQASPYGTPGSMHHTHSPSNGNSPGNIIANQVGYFPQQQQQQQQQQQHMQQAYGASWDAQRQQQNGQQQQQPQHFQQQQFQQQAQQQGHANNRFSVAMSSKQQQRRSEYY